MADNELLGQARRFPFVVGGLLVAPRRTLGEIGASGRGGFSALVIWCLVAAVALRFRALADALVGFDAGGGISVLSVLVGELGEAVPVALAASLAIVIFAGKKRDLTVDFELGCGATIPYAVARAAFRAGAVVLDHDPSLRARQISYAVAGAWALALVALSVRLALGRPSPRGPAPTPGERRVRGVAGALALAVLAAGLARNASWTMKNAAALGPVSRGTLAPDFSLPRIDGKPGTIALASLRGHVVLLDFWATWCPPCLKMLPTMHELALELEPKGVTFLGVDSDGDRASRDEVTEFVAEHGAPYPVVYDEGAVNELYRVKVLPTMVIVGKDGSVERVLTGYTSKGTLADALGAALAR